MKSERTIANSSDFRRLYESGRRARRDGVTVFVAERPAAELPTRLGLTVPRSAGTAVARNRTKRRLRAALRECAPGAGIDVVIRADGAAVGANFQELVGHLSGALGDTGVVR
jgi:ribonuclease P protein component